MIESYANIETFEDAQKAFIKLIDFGYSLDHKDDLSELSKLMDPFIIGTPEYMAPEVIEGGK